MEIIKYPDQRLYHISKEVSLPLSKEDKALLDEMYNYVKEHKEDAVGLSAIQVGVPKRMCAIIRTFNNRVFNYKLVNPKVITHSPDYIALPEGCLSVEEKHEEPVKRWRTVMVSGFDAITGKNVIIKAEGFEARILQHEIDHMNGILYTERLEK